VKTQVQSTADVPKNAHQCSQVNVPRSMHIEADLLNSVGNIRPSECEVLQAPARLRKSEASEAESGMPAMADSLGLVSTGVVQGLHAVMPARARMSSMYWC
jgi:hypothetical protein